GIPIGTPAYISPEQCLGRDVDARTDIYSLGIILFEVLTGRLPFAGSTVAEVMTRHVQEMPPAPSSIRNLSPEVEKLILCCIDKEGTTRVQPAAEVRELAAEILRGRTPPAARQSHPDAALPRLEPKRALPLRQPGNLPAPQTSLVGRQELVESVGQILTTRGV